MTAYPATNRAHISVSAPLRRQSHARATESKLPSAATDLQRIRRRLQRVCNGHAGESPQKQAKRPTPIPRVFGGFRPPLLAFAKH
jgi:hypothetical protein